MWKITVGLVLLIAAAATVAEAGGWAELNLPPPGIQERIDALEVVVYESERPFPGWENPLSGQVLDRLTWGDAGRKWMVPAVQSTYMPGCLKDWCDYHVCHAVSVDLLGVYNDRNHPVAFGVDPMSTHHTEACHALFAWEAATREL